jgi:hypothetical protein
VPALAVSYKAVEKDVRGPKMQSAKTVRKDIIEHENLQFRRASVGDYELK